MLSASAGGHASCPVSLILLHRTKQRFREWNFFVNNASRSLEGEGRNIMSLMEILTLLTVILMLLSLILDAVRLTVEVMEKFSQRKNDSNKKD